MFNMHGFYGGSDWTLSRFMAPFAEGLNQLDRLPQYVIMLLDKDLILNICGKKKHTGIILGAAIHYLIKQIDTQIARRVKDLTDKKPGAVTKGHPHVIWVCMLKCPDNLKQKCFTLRNKFNSILEARLLEANDWHRIMSIEIPWQNFTNSGDLTSDGQTIFWSEIDKAMKKFHKGEIKLRPRANIGLDDQKVNQAATKCKPALNSSDFVAKALKAHNEEKRIKLKTPPPKERKSKERSYGHHRNNYYRHSRHRDHHHHSLDRHRRHESGHRHHHNNHNHDCRHSRD